MTVRTSTSTPLKSALNGTTNGGPAMPTDDGSALSPQVPPCHLLCLHLTPPVPLPHLLDSASALRLLSMGM